MDNITTLGAVFDKVDVMSAGCHDKNINVADISFHSLDTIKIGSDWHDLRTVAQRAISNRLGIPYQYLQKCPADIQAENLNYWIQHEKNSKLFFRFDGDDVRAIFTPKYKPMDNFEVMERLDAIGFSLATEVQCSLDSEFMSLSIPDGKQAFEIDGDSFKPGISISNSEVGLASLSISAFILRLVCTNGLISKSDVSASYRHISTKILAEFPDVISHVSQELGRHRAQFKLSMESPVDAPEATMSSFNRQFGLNAMEKEAVEWAWPKKAGETMFSVVNTYTRASQFDGLNAESANRLQRVGGNILSMVK